MKIIMDDVKGVFECLEKENITFSPFYEYEMDDEILLYVIDNDERISYKNGNMIIHTKHKSFEYSGKLLKYNCVWNFVLCSEPIIEYEYKKYLLDEIAKYIISIEKKLMLIELYSLEDIAKEVSKFPKNNAIINVKTNPLINLENMEYALQIIIKPKYPTIVFGEDIQFSDSHIIYKNKTDDPWTVRFINRISDKYNIFPKHLPKRIDKINRILTRSKL